MLIRSEGRSRLTILGEERDRYLGKETRRYSGHHTLQLPLPQRYRVPLKFAVWECVVEKIGRM
jgi:hypothetical protein